MPGGENQHRIAFATYGGYGQGPTEAIGSLELIKELFQGQGFVGFFACPGKILYEQSSEKISQALKINKFRAQELIVRYKEGKMEYFTDYTPEQIQMLEKLGCSIYQGYYYSRPLPLDAFIEYVKGL